MSQTNLSPREQLKALEDVRNKAGESLPGLRGAVKRATKAWESTGKGFRAVEEAKADLADRQAEVKAIDAKKVEVLEQIADGGAGAARAGFNADGPHGTGGEGWAHVARELDRTRESTVEAPAREMLAAAFNVTPSSGVTAPAIIAPFVAKARPRLFLFTSFPPGEVEEGKLGVQEWQQVGNRTVTGSVLRDPLSTGTKATVELGIKLEQLPLKQVAIVAREIQNALFAAVDLFEQWLLSELLYQLQIGAESHCLEQIAASDPPTDIEGETLIEQIRFGVRRMKEAGATPSVVALSPADAETLDVQKASGSGEYVFASRDSGTASPIYGCQVVEVAGLEAPILVDPTIAGVMYLGLARTIADPYTGNDHNITKIVSEAEGLLHIRDTAGLFVLAESA